MTLSIVGRCKKTNKFGIAIASSPLTVTTRCSFVEPGVGAVATQCATNPELGPLGLKLLKMGYSPERVVEELRSTDPLIEIRQIGVIDKHGRTAAYTGCDNGDYKDQVFGDNVVAVGNGLAGPDVVSEMVRGFEEAQDERFEERLLRGLEGGWRVGGDRLGHWSAGIIVFGNNVFPSVDLRVEMHLPLPGGTPDAVAELRRIFDAYAPMIDYYEERPLKFDEMGEWDDWLAKNNPEHLKLITSSRPDPVSG